MPVIRYSTARSGFIKAARIAFMTSSRSNPISIICDTVASMSSPITSVDAEDSYDGAAPAVLVLAAGAGAAWVGVAAGASAPAGAVGVTALGAASGAGSEAGALGLDLLTMTTNMSASATP